MLLSKKEALQGADTLARELGATTNIIRQGDGWIVITDQEAQSYYDSSYIDCRLEAADNG